MVVSTFSILDKDDRVRFFKKSFLLANIKLDIVLFEMFFLTINNANINFKAQNLQQRFYITAKVFFITKRVEVIEKKKFIIAAFDLNYKVFIIYVSVLNINFNINNKIYPLEIAQIAH